MRVYEPAFLGKSRVSYPRDRTSSQRTGLVLSVSGASSGMCISQASVSTLRWLKIEDVCARSRYQGQGQVITSHSICTRVCVTRSRYQGQGEVYIPHYLQDAIICPCPWYLLLASVMSCSVRITAIFRSNKDVGSTGPSTVCSTACLETQQMSYQKPVMLSLCAANLRRGMYMRSGTPTSWSFAASRSVI